MAPGRFSSCTAFGFADFSVAATLMLFGCGEGAASNPGENTPSGGQGGSAGRNPTAGQSPTGGQNTGGTADGGRNSAGGHRGGQNSMGGQPGGAAGGAGVQRSAGGMGGILTPTGGTPAGGSSAGISSTGGAANSGSGGAGASAGGSAGTGGTGSGECTRALLDGLLDDYFAALSAGDASSLPLAAGVKFTENAQEAEIGTTDFWMNAGETKYSQRALDTEACSVAAQAVIPEQALDLPVAVRIQVVGGEITEIESIVVRPGDYTASFAVDSNPAAIIASANDIGWHDEVPEAERATRQELSAWIDKYFRAFPAGVCNTTSACKRLENGGGNFACGNSCSASTPTSGGTFEPRVIVVDEVRGIAAGLTIFDYMTTGHLDMHMVKLSGGQVHAVHAILRDTSGESGWD